MLAWWCRALKDEIGRVTGAFSSARDITERERTAEALWKSERNFRETAKNLDEGFYSCTMAGLLLEHNDAFNRILGFDIALDLKGVKLPNFWQYRRSRCVNKHGPAGLRVIREMAEIALLSDPPAVDV